MKKKSSVIILVLFITAAVLMGLLLVNKGDGPVAGMILSSHEIGNTEAYKNREASPGAEDYMVQTKEYNSFKIRNYGVIPAGKELYANIHLVECPKGAEFTAHWSMDGKVVKKETKKLASSQQGIISYLLEGSSVKSGQCRFELYSGNIRIFEGAITIK